MSQTSFSSGWLNQKAIIGEWPNKPGGQAAFCSKLFRLPINTRGAIWFELFSTKINKLFIFHQPYFRFPLKSLQKNSCRLLHGNSYPGAVAADKTRRGPACLPACPQSPVGEQSTWKLEHSIHPEIPPRARPFSRGVLFLSGVFRIFLEAELRLTSRRWPYETMPERSRRNSHWVSSPSVARGGGAHRAQRVSVLHRAVIDASVWGRWSALGSVIPGSLHSWKAAWIWLLKVLEVKWLATGAAPSSEAANLRAAHWSVSLKGMTPTSGLQWQPWHKLPAEEVSWGFPQSWSNAITVPFRSQGQCRRSKSLLQGI